MDQEASVWLVVYSGLDQEDNKRKKEKKKKEKGALCGFLCWTRRSLGLGSMREFGEGSAHGWEKDPWSHYVGRVWDLGIQHCPTGGGLCS